MKFEKYIMICESDKKFVMDALKMEEPIEKDYLDDEYNRKEAEKNIRELKKAIRFQKKDIKSWEKKRHADDNIEAAEAILDDLLTALKRWEDALEPPPEPEPDEEPKPEEPIPGEEEPEGEPDQEEEPEEEPEEGIERKAGIVSET